MNKLNRIIGGSAIAIAVMAMGGSMTAQGMEKAKVAQMRGVQMKGMKMPANAMKSGAMKTAMGRLGANTMIG